MRAFGWLQPHHVLGTTSWGHRALDFANLKGRVFGLKKVVWVGILLSMFQQLVGINVIFYYSMSLWRSIGFSDSNSFAISLETSIVDVAVTLVAGALVERRGAGRCCSCGSTTPHTGDRSSGCSGSRCLACQASAA